jgi:hypothetical protein
MPGYPGILSKGIMGTVTYKNQPGIEKLKGNVPLAGTSHLYTVKKRLWNDAI